MPRLRTTTVLSVLLLGGGVAGTAWLSALSGPPSVTVAGQTRARQHASASTPTRSRMPAPMAALRRPPTGASATAVLHPARFPSPFPLSSRSLAPAPAPELAVSAPPAEETLLSLQPLQSPMQPMPYRQLREHRRGTLALRVSIDGDGRVRRAALHDSSGDAVLDDYALASVYAWRFAVPAGHAQGADGEVTLRFTDGDDARLAELR